MGEFSPSLHLCTLVTFLQQNGSQWCRERLVHQTFDKFVVALYNAKKHEIVRENTLKRLH
jgi:hypothetical protein